MLFYNIISYFYDFFFFNIFKLGNKTHPFLALNEQINDSKINVLDVCTGTANIPLNLAKEYPQLQITGVDTSEGMLKVANKKITKQKIKNMRLIKMNATKLDFKDEFFDIVTINFILHEIPQNQRDKLLIEAVRALKTGGTLYILDFALHKDRKTKLFMAIWSIIEPKSFKSYLRINWENELLKYNLEFINKKAFSFSDLIIAKK
ncbi:class I SAM-dependent methyltransferase [bacterium]|jgi:ubiquinone/menaquinone biosynthesis C-methylase UbiE|nr:class I SAM-dependent methyltransferase [bacterium]MBT5988155.1 class I SAM-dependent methyltransferase [bacterium]